MTESKDIKASLGAIVKELRNHKGITQEQLAEFLGLQPHTITKIETGRSFISSEVLAKLCNFFNVDPAFFFAKKAKVITEDDLNYIREIKQILPEFSSSKLKEIYNILLVMQK